LVLSVQPPNEDIRLSLMLAEFAQIHAGKLTIVGAGLFAVFALGPTPMQQLAVCGTILLPFPELNRQHVVSIDLYDSDDKPVSVPTPMGEKPFKVEAFLNAALPPMMPRGSSVSVPFSVMFTIPIRPGVFHFVAIVSGDERTRIKLPFTVLTPPANIVPQVS
jgi:hypothetical protein